MIVTFYSFKGGVGRSMALVNVAEILADRGYRVIVCDWDLEAPGLERYFTSREVAGVDWKSILDDLTKAPGLIDLLTEYRDSLSKPAARPAAAADGYAQLGDIMVRRPSSVAVPVSTRLGTTDRPHLRTGSLRLLTAGRRDGIYRESYADVVRSFDWEEFYNRWAGGSYVHFLRSDLVRTPEGVGAADILLLDARTGVSEQGGVCTHHLADLVVLMSAANDSNLSGIEWMADALTDDRLAAMRDGRPLQVLPVAARIEQTSQKEELVDFRHRFLSTFRRYTSETSGITLAAEQFAQATEIPYMPFYSFIERIVAREAEDRREQNLYMKYVQLAEAIVANGVARNLLRDSGVRAERLDITRRIPSQVRNFSVYLSVARRSSALGKTIAAGLSRIGLEVITRADRRDDAWRKTSRYIVLIDESTSPAQEAEIAEITRQAALREDIGIRALLVEQTMQVPDLGLGTPVSVPRDLAETNVSYFDALAAEIAASDVALPPTRRIAYRPDQPLTEEFAAYLFGRDAELAEVSRWPGVSRWLEVKGYSGVGKTSFVRAGVIPMIRRGALFGIPEDVEIHTPAAITDIRAMTAGLRDRAARDPTLLFIDDFEELVWLGALDAWQSIRECLTIEGFFLITAARMENLFSKEPLQRFSITLSPLRLAAARQALIRPAKLAGLTWEKGLPQRVVCDLAEVSVSGSSEPPTPAVDPSLLAMVAADLAEESQLTHEKYDQIGGCIADRLAKYADDALARTDDVPRARALLVRLASATGESRPLPVPSALSILGPGGNQFLDKLAALRLIRVGETVELRHSMMARSWRTLRQWMAEEEGYVDALEALTAAREVWEATGRVSSALPQGDALDFISRAAYDEPSREFVEEATERQIARQRVFIAIGVLLLVAGIVLRSWILDTQRQLEREHDGDWLALRALEVDDPLPSLIVAIAAGEKGETPLTRQALVRAVRGPSVRGLWQLPDRAIAAALSSDGASLLTVTSTGLIATWETQSGKVLQNDRIGPGLPPVSSYDFSAGPSAFQLLRSVYLNVDGPFVTSPKGEEAVVWGPKSVQLWSSTPLRWRMVDANVPVTDIAFTPDGETLVGISPGGVLHVWTSLHDPNNLPIRSSVRAHAKDISSFAISARGDRIITTSENTAAMWTINGSIPTFAGWFLRAAKPITVPKHAFGNRDRSVMLLDSDGIHIWPVAAPVGGMLMKRPFERIAATDFSPTAPEILIAANDGRMVIYRLGPGSTIAVPLRGHTSAVNTASFSADGTQIVSASDDKTVRLWRIAVVTPPDDFASLLDSARQRLPVTLTEADRATWLAQTIGQPWQ